MKRTTVTALVATGLLATACSTGEDHASGPDPADYYRDYQEQEYEGGGAAPAAVDSSQAESTGASVEPEIPEFTEDNTFIDVGDSIWTRTQDDRESTFALDVDTGSYRIAQAFAAQGEPIEPDSVRVEEWVNAFDYGDPEPADQALGVTVETAAAPRSQEATLMRVGIATRALAADERPAAHITFVVDTSGSMDIRERLGLVKSSLALLVQNLQPQDTIAVVTYGSTATPLLAPTPVAEADTIYDAIDDLQAGGSTNMEAGLYLGYDLARESFDPEAVNVVVLASDGVANVGSSDPTVLTDTIAEAGSEGISLVTVGFGMGNYNDHLMEQLANLGDGFYSYVDTVEEAERLFVDDLTPTLAVVAYDSKVQVVFDDEQTESYRLIGYENRELDDSQFRDDTVDAGELGAGHHVTALYEVIPAEGYDPTQPFADVYLRWATEKQGEVVEAEQSVGWPQPEAVASDDLLLAALVADTAELAKGNEAAVDKGLTLAQLHQDARDLAQRDVPGAQEIVDLLEQVEQAS